MSLLIRNYRLIATKRVFCIIGGVVATTHANYKGDKPLQNSRLVQFAYIYQYTLILKRLPRTAVLGVAPFSVRFLLRKKPPLKVRYKLVTTLLIKLVCYLFGW